MRLSHDPARTHASFDDPNLVSRAGLVPLMALAGRCGLADLAGEHVKIASRTGVNPDLKIPCLVAGMAAGADSIDDMDVLRHGAMTEVFGGIRAPSTLGSFLRSFTWGNVRQLDAVARQFLGALAAGTPLLPGAGVLAFIDMDSMQKRVYGHAKQGAGFGHTKIQGKSLTIRGLNALAAVISTPLAAPVIAATRLRGGKANSARGAARWPPGDQHRPPGRVHRQDRVPDRFGVLLRRGPGRDPPRRRVLLGHRADGPQDPRRDRRHRPGRLDAPITYPRAIWDEDQHRLISDAEVAEVPYTAFASKKGKAITARLIVRRVKDLNRKAAEGQDELFTIWRYHALFTDSPFEMIQAEAQHRDHAIVEQVFADLVSGPLAHLPSGHFPANAAWLALAAICHNLTRAAGCLAGAFSAKARGATIRSQLIAVAARIARHGRGHITMHLPEGWHRETEWMNLFETACGPPATAA